MRKPRIKPVYVAFLLVGFLLAQSLPLRGEQLPLKIYTTTEGLPSNYINSIVRDSHGFLWVCTTEGLSRFDGYTFTNYGVAQGLPDRAVSDFLETRSGEYWVGTVGGLCRFDPQQSAQAPGRQNRGNVQDMFSIVTRSYPKPDPPVVNSLYEDRAGTVWCGTNEGLYRVVKTKGQWTLEYVNLGVAGPVVDVLRGDRQGALWIGAQGCGLLRRWPDGRLEHFTQREGLTAGDVKALYQDHQGCMWVGTTKGLCQLVPDPQPLRRVVSSLYTTRDGLPVDWVYAVLETSDGKLWVATSGGLAESSPGGVGGRVFRAYGLANGLTYADVEALAEDREGNLWIGSSYGVMKLARDGFRTYTTLDGLSYNQIVSVFENQAGQLCVINHLAQYVINCLEGARFTAVTPKVPKAITATGWGWGQVGLQDHAGEWWLASAQGLLRYAKVARLSQLARTLPKAVYTTHDGLTRNSVFRLFEDSRGDIWVGTEPGVARWERSTQQFHRYGPAEGLTRTDLPTAVGEDRAGDIWVGFYWHDVARYRNSRFTVFTANDGLPNGSVLALYSDREGRLWVGTTRGGVARIDDPAAEHPKFFVYSTADGLSSNQVKEITGDSWGRIYIMTARSVDCLDPATGRIRHYTTADGLVAVGSDSNAFRDRQGALWFGTGRGLSRLVPEPPAPTAPPPIRIDGLRIGGLPYPIWDPGEKGRYALELDPDQNQIQIDFASLNFGVGDVLRYQYRLDGADREWSSPTDQRSVSYARLGPGRYRFLVRAVNSDGLFSPEPAEVSFHLLPPIWQRGWFIVLAAILLASSVYAFHHYRVERLLELERVRARIATDLHDDIGSSLSQVAILSEVVRQQAGRDNPGVGEPLARIASISRELVDSMGDIVWAINPRKDSFRDLAQRMRRFASDVLAPRNIELDFRSSDPFAGTALHADVRREVFLIFKEAINNAVRHSACRHVVTDLGIEKHQILLRIQDDGRGLDPIKADDGHGLRNMAARAHSLGGSLELHSGQGQGVCVTLRLPLEGSFRRQAWRRLRNRKSNGDPREQLPPIMASPAKDSFPT